LKVAYFYLVKPDIGCVPLQFKTHTNKCPQALPSGGISAAIFKCSPLQVDGGSLYLTDTWFWLREQVDSYTLQAAPYTTMQHDCDFTADEA